MSTVTYSDNSVNRFSSKRCFINNLDGYHAEYIVQELSKMIKQEAVPLSRESSSQRLGESDYALSVPHESQFEIIGTVKDFKITKLKNVARIVSKSDCLPQMLTCGIVILDISYDTNELKIASEYIELLKKLFEVTKSNSSSAVGAGDTNTRQLILISTVMTWAMTKPLDPDTPDMPFVETDFRKRKPYPSYKQHLNIENEVIALGKRYQTCLRTIVVAIGVTYGGRQEVLYYWFQKAWECEPLLPILGRGNNAVPLIHVNDLASIIFNLISDFPRKHYILAVEQNITKQKEIIKTLGRIAGSGMFKSIPAEEAFLIPELNQRIYDLMTLNLNLEPTFIVETMRLQWTSELTFPENIPKLMKQFKKERKLKPFKVVIYGPPLVGKTTLSKQICYSYGLPYISPETIIQDSINELEFRINHIENNKFLDLEKLTGEEDDVEIDDDEDDEDLETLRQKLAVLESGHHFSDDEILGYIRKKLLNHESQNRGWILDGYPTNLAQCSLLFEKGNEQDDIEDDNDGEIITDEQFEEDAALYDNVLKRILPDIVVSLEADDEFICDKAMCQPEGDPRLKEDVVLRRLGDFRSGDLGDVTPLNFFDELDIHPLVVPVMDHTDYDMKGPYAEVTLRMGAPCRYEKLLAIIEADEKKEKKIYETLKAKEEKLQKELEEKMQREREERMEYWSELHALLREEEEAAMAAAAEPMRNYLMHNIFPTLTQALLEIAKIRPKDPIDYLAEYLFKLNPTGKMLEPGFNLQAELLFGKIKILDEALKDLDINIGPLAPADADIG